MSLEPGPVRLHCAGLAVSDGARQGGIAADGRAWQPFAASG